MTWFHTLRHSNRWRGKGIYFLPDLLILELFWNIHHVKCHKSSILMSMAEILHLGCIKTRGKSGEVFLPNSQLLLTGSDCRQTVVLWLSQKCRTLKMDPRKVILVPMVFYGGTLTPLIFKPRHSWGEVLPAGSPSGSPQASGCGVVARASNYDILHDFLGWQNLSCGLSPTYLYHR